MALIRCPECNNAISEHAPYCIHCGCPMEIIRKIIDQNKAAEELKMLASSNTGEEDDQKQTSTKANRKKAKHSKTSKSSSSPQVKQNDEADTESEERMRLTVHLCGYAYELYLLRKVRHLLTEYEYGKVRKDIERYYKDVVPLANRLPGK